MNKKKRYERSVELHFAKFIEEKTSMETYITLNQSIFI